MNTVICPSGFVLKILAWVLVKVHIRVRLLFKYVLLMCQSCSSDLNQSVKSVHDNPELLFNEDIINIKYGTFGLKIIPSDVPGVTIKYKQNSPKVHINTNIFNYQLML